MVIQDGVVSGVVLGAGELGGSGHADGISDTSSKRTGGSFNTRGVVL